MPSRIQRRRIKGWRMPEGAIYVGRGSRWGNPFIVDAVSALLIANIRPEVRSGAAGTLGRALVRTPRWREFTSLDRPARHVCVDAFEAACWHIRRCQAAWFDDWIAPLRGHDLVCWCGLCRAHRDGRPGISWQDRCPWCSPCHADVLLELANA